MGDSKVLQPAQAGWTLPADMEDEATAHSDDTLQQGKQKRGDETTEGEGAPNAPASSGSRQRKVTKTSPAGEEAPDENQYGCRKHNTPQPADAPAKGKKK